MPHFPPNVNTFFGILQPIDFIEINFNMNILPRICRHARRVDFQGLMSWRRSSRFPKRAMAGRAPALLRDCS